MLNQFQWRWHLLLSLFVPTLVATLLLTIVHGDAAPANRNGLSITIAGTREHLAAGTSFGVDCILTNNTNEVVYVNEEYLKLKVPPEMLGPNETFYSFWYGHLIAANHPSTAKPSFVTLPLMPGSATPVSWLFLANVPRQTPEDTPQPSTHTSDYWTALRSLYEELWIEFSYLFFVPGHYQIVVTADYWNKADLTDIPSRAVETANLDVAAPLLIILTGAAIGGLIYIFLFVPHAKLVSA